MRTADDIQIRDPFVFVEDGRYYLFGTTDANCWHGRAAGFDAFVSEDLIRFSEGVRIFEPSADFWGTENFWAPEMYRYRDAYYLFASFKAPNRRRATAILRADSPLEPYAPWGAEQVTPPEWECLDGTLYVDKLGLPYVVFCHEWLQEGGGTICVRRLKADLSGPEGEAVTLFTATDAPWPRQVTHSSGVKGFVTDGPFLYQPENGKLYMLWSSLSETGYAIGLAISDSGKILGPWRQQEKPLFAGDGGHGMLFRTKEGELRLAIHAPNKTPNERAMFLPVRETAEGLTVEG